MIQVISKGGTKAKKHLEEILNRKIDRDLHRWGQMGLEALQNSTPVDTGLSAESWGYRISRDSYGPRIEWFNTHTVNGTSVVILIQYGHATGTGGYVQGREFINRAMKPVFEKINDEIRKKVRS